MFIDEIKINLKAGNGGNGVVAWRHEKCKEFAGPAGGNGGKGGDVYIRGVRNLNLLFKYRNIKEFKAERGQDGGGRSKWGEKGEDRILDLPIGSIISNLRIEKKWQLLKNDEKILLLSGGKGGYGNEHFKASTNTSPEQFTLGKPGEEGVFFIELELIADLGIIGLPNAGKSSILNALTHTSAKVGSYAFTTLEPNLGDFYGYILADIPGLIEGASEGKGLGHKFLRHIKRTKIILHCVSLENENITDAYKTIKEELKKYGNELVEKKEIILLTKSDTVSEAVLKEKIKEIKKLNPKVASVSVYDDASINDFKKKLLKIFSEYGT